jgi:amino acid adenylation domain-containing protein
MNDGVTRSAGLVHELFEGQAARTPDAPALLHAERCLTYAELNSRANRLARYLRRLGVGPDRTVGICLPRSFEMVVALLGTLKAGGAYVPLDPSYPAERLRFMLSDVAPTVLLTQRDVAPALTGLGVQVLMLDESALELAALSEENLRRGELGSTSQDLVYVIYTSGSTGRPKGTAMPHCSMVNLIEWHQRALPIRTGCRVLQFAALSFDVAFQETFSTLCAGGTLVLLDDWMRRDTAALMNVLNTYAIERLFLTPLMLQAVADHAHATDVVPAALRDVIAAGEQLRISRKVVELFQRVPGCRLHNHYGPTETHVVTALTLDGEPAAWPALPSIGRSIANSTICLLDERLQLVANGAVGEIYIGGSCLARGYLNHPTLTAERFTVMSLGDEPPTRRYRTGDLGRWHADGTLEYLGRNDDQVKIRGVRVELGEIESLLAQHRHVRQAAVVANDSRSGKRLVAYVTAADDVSPQELRAHLQSILPDHMVPSAFVRLDTMPVTPSGKLDRRSLPPPAVDSLISQPYEAASGDMEELAAAIWRELLHVERIGRHDNFLDLGGDSLLAMQMVARVRARLSIQLPVSAVFEHPTLAQLAAHLESLRDARFHDQLARGGDEVEGLLEYVSSLSEANVEQLLRSLSIGGRP